MKAFKYILLLCLLLLATCPSHAADSDWWDRRWKCRRRVLAFGLTRAYPGDDAASATFYTHGYLAPGGADIRVVAGGELVPHRMVSLGPGDRAHIIFKITRGVRVHYIYFGNPGAPKVSYDWQPKRGLKLTTSRYNGGRVDNWQQTRMTFARSSPVFGAGFVKWVFLGHNPFGPSHSFCAKFEGWIDCPSRGEYAFATTSGNASFLLIDGQLVVSWPGWHGPVANARHQKKVWLEKGMHKIEYFGVHTRGRVAFVAAWRPPGQWMFRVIPQSAYVRVSRAEVQKIELVNKQVVPDFSAENEGQATLTGKADRYLIKIGFRNKFKVTPVGRYSWRWDFGDGNQAEEFAPKHIYLAPGVYPVKVTLRWDGRTCETTQRIAVHRDWARQTEVGIDKRESYYPQLSAYDFARMPVTHLVNAFDYFREIEKTDDAIRVGKLLLVTREPMEEGTYFERMLRLGELLVGKKDYQTSVKVYQQALTRLSEVGRRAQMKLQLADTLLVRLGNLSQAEALYKEVLAEKELNGALLRRRALIGQGDIWRRKGDYQKAEAAYRRAERIPVVSRTPMQDLVMPAAYARAIEGYMQKDEFAQAKEHLERWEWEKPTTRLQGLSTILRARLYIAEEERRSAVAELEALVSANPASEYAPAALSLLAQCELVLRRPERALKALETLKVDYPESPLQKDLEERIAKVSKFVRPKR